MQFVTLLNIFVCAWVCCCVTAHLSWKGLEMLWNTSCCGKVSLIMCAYFPDTQLHVIYIIKLKLLRFLSFASLQIYYKNLEWNMLMEYLANGLVIWGWDYLFLSPGFKSTIRLHGKLNFLPFLGKSNSWKWSVSLKLLCRLEGIKPYS